MGAKFTVVIMAVASLVFAVPGMDYPWTGFWLALFTASMAFSFHVLPFVDWEKSNGELSRLWNDLRNECELEEMKVCTKTQNDSVGMHRVERLGELQKKAYALIARNNTPNQATSCIIEDQKTRHATSRSSILFGLDDCFG